MGNYIYSTNNIKKHPKFKDCSKEQIITKKFMNGQNNSKKNDYIEHNDNPTHKNFWSSYQNYFTNFLNGKKYEKIDSNSHMNEKGQKARDSIVFQIRNEYIKNNNIYNYKEDLKYLINACLNVPNNDLKQKVSELCYKDFMNDFDTYFDKLEKNPEFWKFFEFLPQNEKEIKERFAFYLKIKGAKFNLNHNALMAKKYIELANSLCNNNTLIRNEGISYKNLKNSGKNDKNFESLSSIDNDEFENDKKITEILKNINFNSNSSNDVKDLIKRDNTYHNKDSTLSNSLKKFNKALSQNQSFLKVIKEGLINLIYLIYSILNYDSEDCLPIGIGFIEILYLEFDIKNWTIGLGSEMAYSFYETVKNIFKLEFWNSINGSVYGEIYINLKAKNLKEIFGYDIGLTFGQSFEVGPFYISTSRIKSFIDIDDN